MSEVTGSGSGSGRFRKSWNLLKQVPKGPSMLTANSAIEIFLSHMVVLNVTVPVQVIKRGVPVPLQSLTFL